MKCRQRNLRIIGFLCPETWHISQSLNLSAGDSSASPALFNGPECIKLARIEINLDCYPAPFVPYPEREFHYEHD